jgi:hypothetical protein
VKADSTVAPTPIAVGEQTGDIVVVEKGVSAGQQVVTSNQYRLQPGTLVRANGPEAARAQPARVVRPDS